MKQAGETREYNPGDLYFNPGSGLGIKFGGFPNAGDFGWRDITGQIIVRTAGATDPDWAQVGSGSFYAYKFAVGDMIWMSYHIPHDFVPDTPVYFHAHWITDGTSASAVTWEWTYTYAKGFSQAAFDPTGSVITAAQAASGTAYQHMVTETTGQTIEGLSEPDGIIYIRLRRVNNNTSPLANNADGVFLLTADVHYQSTNIATVNKAPGFYG